MFRDPDTIPPQPGYPFKLNPKLPRLDKMNIRVADGKVSFIPRPKGDGTRKLLVNNFDAAVSPQMNIRKAFGHANAHAGRQHMHCTFRSS